MLADFSNERICIIAEKMSMQTVAPVDLPGMIVTSDERADRQTSMAASGSKATVVAVVPPHLSGGGRQPAVVSLNSSVSQQDDRYQGCYGTWATSPTGELKVEGGGARGRLRRFRCKLEQQEIAGSSAPLWCFGRQVQAGLAGACAALFALLGAALLCAASSVTEVVVEYGLGDTHKTLTVSRDLEGPVLLWYKLEGLQLNHKSVLENKDGYLASSFFNRIGCDGAETLHDARWRRPGDWVFLAGPGDAAPRPSEMDRRFRPCGLVSIAMFTDAYELRASRGGAQIPLDETDLALEEDRALYDDKIVPVEGRLLVEGEPSWLRGGVDLEHFMVWHRTPASPRTRHLWARVGGGGGLPAGEYVLNITRNSPVWSAWHSDDRSVILAPEYALASSGACRMLGVLCVVMACSEVIVFLAYLVKPRTSASD